MTETKAIKFAGAREEKHREFLRKVIREEEYRFEGGVHRLRTAEDCDKSLFHDHSEFPVFEASRNPDAPAPKYALAKVCVSTEDFIQAQAMMLNLSFDSFTASVDRERLRNVSEGIREGHEVPIPVLEFKVDGELNNHQEGRHRSVAAWELGNQYMPVFLAKQVRD